jgi:transcriptional regulator GlxA family with amidase domain
MRSIRFRSESLVEASEPDRQARARLGFLRRRAHIGRHLVRLSARASALVRRLAAQAIAEDAGRLGGYRCVLKGIALQMVVVVARELDFRWPDATASGSGIVDVLEMLEADPTQPVRVARVAARAGLSRSQFHAAFKKMTGTTLMDHVARLRAVVAQRLLTGTEMPVLDVCFESGFESVSRFYEVFRKMTGTAPAAFRRKHRGRF